MLTLMPVPLSCLRAVRPIDFSRNPNSPQSLFAREFAVSGVFGRGPVSALDEYGRQPQYNGLVVADDFASDMSGGMSGPSV